MDLTSGRHEFMLLPAADDTRWLEGSQKDEVSYFATLGNIKKTFLNNSIYHNGPRINFEHTRKRVAHFSGPILFFFTSNYLLQTTELKRHLTLEKLFKLTTIPF